MRYKWTVKQFFVVMVLCGITIICSGIYGFFIDVKEWKYVFKPMQIVLAISGAILVIDVLRSTSE